MEFCMFKTDVVFHYLTTLQEDARENEVAQKYRTQKLGFTLALWPKHPSFSRSYASEVHLKEAIFRPKVMPNR